MRYYFVICLQLFTVDDSKHLLLELQEGPLTHVDAYKKEFTVSKTENCASLPGTATGSMTKGRR